MVMSEKYYRSLDKLKSRLRDEGLKTTVGAVQEAFESSMGKVPEDLARAVFLRFLDGFNRSGKAEGEFIESAYSLGPFIDVFWMEYDAKEDPLSGDDWVFLRETVNEAAGELDLKILTYVMQLIVEHGKIR